jgi:hypothetical protein
MTTPEQYDGGPVAQMILEGNYDEDLEVIQRALAARHRIVQQQRAAETAAQLRTGDRIRVVGRIKPKYLIGCEGTVKRIAGDKAFVDATGEFGWGRYGRSADLGVPLSCVEKIASAPPASSPVEDALVAAAHRRGSTRTRDDRDAGREYREPMESGKWYVLTYVMQSGNGRWYRWTMTAQFLHSKLDGGDREQHVFSGRPMFGTTDLPAAHVESWQRATNAEPIRPARQRGAVAAPERDE